MTEDRAQSAIEPELKSVTSVTPLTSLAPLAPLTSLDRTIAAGMSVAYVIWLLVTAKSLGYARDEGFYFQAAESYGRWFELLLQDPGRAFERVNVDRYFSANHEHPALMKSLFALSHRFFFERLHWFDEPGTAYRFPAMLMAGLAIAVIYAWGRGIIGRLGGVIAAASFALMPVMFYHAHLACFDMPVAAMWLVTAYAYFRSLFSKKLGWALVTGVLYGLLLDTKHNAWLLPPALLLHLLLTRGPELWAGLRRGRPSIPLALWSMALLGPPVFYLLWPWIWHDTIPRLTEYVRFHREHEYYNMEFLGRTYWKPPMPRLYAWVMTLTTVPGITLLLFVIGSSVSLIEVTPRSLRQHFGRAGDWISRNWAETPRPSAPFNAYVLWALGVVTSYAPWLSSNTPIFGGTKHWITAYRFLCLFAGLGATRIAERCASGLSTAAGRSSAKVIVAAACLIGPLAMTIESHPFGLSFYAPIVGGAPGAAGLGLNRTFWGYTTQSVVGFINQQAPRHASVYLHDTAFQSWDMLRDDGRVRSDLRPTLAIHQSKLALYHHEPHMRRVEFQIWVDYGTAQPQSVASYEGVPIVWVYQRPNVAP